MNILWKSSLLDIFCWKVYFDVRPSIIIRFMDFCGQLSWLILFPLTIGNVHNAGKILTWRKLGLLGNRDCPPSFWCYYCVYWRQLLLYSMEKTFLESNNVDDKCLEFCSQSADVKMIQIQDVWMVRFKWLEVSVSKHYKMFVAIDLQQFKVP